MKRDWTQEEIDTLTRMYPNHYAREIAGILGRGIISQEEKVMIAN